MVWESTTSLSSSTNYATEGGGRFSLGARLYRRGVPPYKANKRLNGHPTEPRRRPGPLAFRPSRAEVPASPATHADADLAGCPLTGAAYLGTYPAKTLGLDTGRLE